MDNTTQFFAFALLIGLFAVYVWKQRRTISDGKAMYWATVKEPRAYVMDDPDDEGVCERAQNARAKLVEHGNAYLDPDKDVWEYVYRADPMTPTMDFDFWQDQTNLNIKQRREQWRKQKAEWNEQAAKEHFGGQRVNAVEWGKPNAN